MVDFRRAEMVARHKDERAKLWSAHEKRWLAETNERAGRLPRGLSGLWRRLTGEYAKIKAQNEQETLQCWQRDRAEKDALIFKQLEKRQALQRDIDKQRAIAQAELMQLRKDVADVEALQERELARSKEERERQQSLSRSQRLYP